MPSRLPFPSRPIGTSRKWPGDEICPDSRIAERVAEMLTASEEIDASGIGVRVQNGVVTLQGRLAHPSDRENAARIARSVRGVWTVHLDLDAPEEAA